MDRENFLEGIIMKQRIVFSFASLFVIGLIVSGLVWHFSTAEKVIVLSAKLASFVGFWDCFYFAFLIHWIKKLRYSSNVYVVT